MANALSTTTQMFTRPYLTLQEYKDAPTGMSLSSLVKGGTQQQQDAVLNTLILQASSWIDQECQQTLIARLEVEQQRVNFGRDQGVRFHPKFHPITALTSFSYGADPSLMISLTDCSVAWIEPRAIVISPLYLGNWYGLQDRTPPRGRSYIHYSYVHGFINTTIATASLTSATSLTLSDVTGIQAGQVLRIADGALSETAVVANNYVYGASPVTLASALTNAHAAGVSIHAMPSIVKEAAILAVSSFLKRRGDGAVVASVSNSPTGNNSGGNRQTDADLADASLMLDTFKRRY